MSEIIPNGKNPNDSSFITKMAQDMLANTPTQSDIEGSAIPTETFSFDGAKIGGFMQHFGPDLRYIKESDKNKAFQIVLNS